MDEKKNVKEPEKKEEPKVEAPQNPDLELLPKNAAGKFFAFLSAKFLQPSIITIFITAILGPLAINWVNESFENKKLQKEVIQTVLNYTSAADFSKPESIEKIGIISRMVDENKEVFGLSFENTNRAIDMLNEISNDVGIKNLTVKLKEAEENILSLSAQLNADSSLYAELVSQNARLNETLAKYKKQGNYNLISEYQNKVAKNDLDITEVNKNMKFHSEQLKYWLEQQNILNSDIKAASDNLSEVLKRNRNNENLLKQQKDTLKIELAKAWNDIKTMKSMLQELQNENKILKDSLNKILIISKDTPLKKK